MPSNSIAKLKAITPIIVSILIIIFAYFRMYNLGYSEFQGDEVAALEFLFGTPMSIKFLLKQTVGPGHYIVAWIFHTLFADKANIEFYVRLPFSIAGIIALPIIYFFTKRYFSQVTALLTLSFTGLSGLLVAFGRFAQYQSVILLISVIVIFLFMRSRESYDNDHPSTHYTHKYYIYSITAGVLSAIGLLFHFDALTFVFAIMLLQLIDFIKDTANLPKPKVIKIIQLDSFKNLIAFTLPFTIVSALFFIPYILNPAFETTFNHLAGNRIISSFKYDAIAYSIKLFLMYHPKEFLWLIGIGVILLIIRIFRQKNPIIILLVTIIVALSGLRIYNAERNQLLIYLSSLGAFLLLLTYIGKLLVANQRYRSTSVIYIWGGFSFLVYGLFIGKPFTHIYTYFIPLFITIAIEFEELLKLRKFQKPILQYLDKTKSGLTILAILSTIVGMFSFNYQGFINTSPEYPWYPKSYIFGKMGELVSTKNKIYGIFGFPYRRGWHEISAQVYAMPDVKKYSSNEKEQVTQYYLRNLKRSNDNYDVYITIVKPQTLQLGQKPKGNTIVTKDTYKIYKRYKPII